MHTTSGTPPVISRPAALMIPPTSFCDKSACGLVTMPRLRSVIHRPAALMVHAPKKYLSSLLMSAIVLEVMLGSKHCAERWLEVPHQS